MIDTSIYVQILYKKSEDLMENNEQDALAHAVNMHAI